MTTTTVSETLGAALGRVSSGMYIITTGSEDQKQGMLASWIIQAGFEPPAVTIAIKSDRHIYEPLIQGGTCVINILGEANNTLIKQFAKYIPDAFNGLNTRETAQGIILEDSLAYLTCKIKHNWQAGDHTILLAEITDGEVLHPEDKAAVHLRKNGFTY